MDVENILKNLVRIGTVSSIDSTKRIARVIFEDKNMVSGWLIVLQHPGAGVYVKPGGEHSHEISGGGTTETSGQHNHESNVTYWMPKINDKVLVLYIPVFNGDGYILGVV
jgi:phage baseplate assembly protein gpV